MIEITIKETKFVKRIVGKEWREVGTEEVVRETKFFSGLKDEPATRITPKYDYTPQIEKEVEETVEVLKQTVETLDLAKVIRAINNL